MGLARIPDVTCGRCSIPCSFIQMHYEPPEEKYVILASCHGQVDKLELTDAQLQDNLVPRTLIAFKEDTCSILSQDSSPNCSTETTEVNNV